MLSGRSLPLSFVTQLNIYVKIFITQLEYVKIMTRAVGGYVGVVHWAEKWIALRKMRTFFLARL